MSALDEQEARAEREVALMRRVARRDPRAQRELVERLAPRIRRLSQLLLRSSNDADDAAQQAMIEILQSASSYRTAGNLEGWASRVAVRAIGRHARREARWRSALDWFALGELVTDTDARRHREDVPRIESYLRRLSAPQREAFVLKHALGCTVEEISDMVGAPSGTVKDRLVNARRRLNKLMDRDAARMSAGSVRRDA